MPSVAFSDTPVFQWRDTDHFLWVSYPPSADIELYQPVILVEVYLTATHRFATKDFYSLNNIYYKGTLLQSPQVERELSDLFYGVAQETSHTLEFANIDDDIDDTWDTIIDGEDIRGESVKIMRYDPLDGTTFELRGKISGYEIKTNTFSLQIASADDDVLETLIPSGTITTDEFSDTALDLGQPINLCFGHCANVPLHNIQNDTTNNYYDYLIGYGTIQGLNVDHDNGLGVKRDGILVSTVNYTLYDGSQASPFSGYAFIRFTNEQMNFSGGYYKISADVKGLEIGGSTAERNFANVIKNILSDTTWGLSESVNNASFDQAESDLNTMGSMYCDGHIYKQTKAKDVLNELLFVCRGTLDLNEDGEWALDIDTISDSMANFGDNDGYYNNCEVLSVSALDTSESIKTAIVHYAHDSANEDMPHYEMEISVNADFGVDQTDCL